MKVWKTSNPEKSQEQARRGSKTWSTKNPQRVAAYRITNKDHLNSLSRAWAKANRPRMNAARARRRARELNATPAWLTPEQHVEILAFYEEARRLTQATGQMHHVDHDIPLQGKNVCGLHVPWNLEILTGPANLSKGNRYDPPS